MKKVLSWRFWDTFRCWLSKGVPKRLFLQGGLTKFFRVCNFGKTLAMSIIFDFKIFQIWCRFQKWKKNWENVLRFSDNFICIGSCKFSQSSTGYLPSAVNVLRNTPKISRNSRGDIFQISFYRNDERNDKSALMAISLDFGTLPHVECHSVFRNGGFYRVICRSFPQSVISKIH